jgi:hypothetical protein
VTIAEMIGETPEMMRACGEVMQAEFKLKLWTERQEKGWGCHEEIRVYRDILADYRTIVRNLVKA